MRIKLMLALVAALAAGAALTVAPLAHADDIFASENNTNPEADGPTITAAFVSDGTVYLQWEHATALYAYDYDGGYNLFRNSGDGNFDFVASIGKGLEAHADEPGEGTHEYRLTYYLHSEGDTYHSKNGQTTAVTVGGTVADDDTDENDDADISDSVANDDTDANDDADVSDVATALEVATNTAAHGADRNENSSPTEPDENGSATPSESATPTDYTGLTR